MWVWLGYVVLSVALIEFALYRAKPLKEGEREFAGTDKYQAFRRRDTHLWSRFHLYLFGIPFLIPRFLLILLCVFIHGITATILLYGQPSDVSTPLPTVRQKILKYSSFLWARLLLWGAGFLWIEERGTVETTAGTLVCNHSSWVDIMYFSTAREFPSFLANEGVKRMPLFGKIGQAMQCMFVNRASSSDRSSALTMVQNRQLDINSGKGFPKLLLFPEGTTTNGSGLLYFRKGAFVSHVPVQGIALQYPYSHFSPTFDSLPMLPHVILLCSQAYNRLVVTRLPVLDLVGATAEDRAQTLREQIAASLQVPLLLDRFEDKFEYISHVFRQKVKYS
jgi:lysophosphatidylcholine acyltransferase/lyso-PAF acetyltransferase